MSKLLFQFRHSGGHPTLEEVQRRFGFTESETDREYGVVEVDEEEGLYTVLVDEAVRTDEQRTRNRAAVQVGAGSEDHQRRELGSDRSDQREGVSVADELETHERDGTGMTRSTDEFHAVDHGARVAEHLEVGLAIEHHPEAGPDDPDRFDDQHPDRARFLARGSAHEPPCPFPKPPISLRRRASGRNRRSKVQIRAIGRQA